MQFDPLKALQSIGTNRAWNGQISLDVGALPYAIPAYSLAGEDLALRKWFKQKLIDRHPGTYVDIGCGSPIEISNTYLFYSYGWRGLCVDAKDWAPSFRLTRPEDIFVHAAIGDTNEQMFYHRHKTIVGMNKLSKSPVTDDPDFHPKPEPVNLQRLGALLDMHMRGKRIDFFSIDVEGSELGVLRSNDWLKWRPRIVLMECHGFDFAAPADSPTVSYLQSQGYRLEEKIGANVLMVDSEARS